MLNRQLSTGLRASRALRTPCGRTGDRRTGAALDAPHRSHSALGLAPRGRSPREADTRRDVHGRVRTPTHLARARRNAGRQRQRDDSVTAPGRQRDGACQRLRHLLLSLAETGDCGQSASRHRSRELGRKEGPCSSAPGRAEPMHALQVRSRSSLAHVHVPEWSVVSKLDLQEAESLDGLNFAPLSKVHAVA